MKMTSRDRFGIILSHFVGFSLKETAEIFSLSTSCVTNDRSRKKEVWRTGYRLIYQEQIEALKYSVEFTKEPYALSSFHGHLSDIYASLNTLLLYEDLPKKFKPPEIWTQALAHHLPKIPLPSDRGTVLLITSEEARHFGRRASCREKKRQSVKEIAETGERCWRAMVSAQWKPVPYPAPTSFLRCPG